MSKKTKNYKQTWSNANDEEDDFFGGSYMEAVENGYDGSFEDWKKEQSGDETKKSWDIDKWVTTGTSVLGSLSDLFGKKGGNGSSAPPPPPAPTKSYTGLWIIGGVVVVGAIIGAICWKNKK